MVISAQSKRSWFTSEFDAACLEAKHKIENQDIRYTVGDKVRYIEKEVCSVPRFAEECKKHTFPSWETIVKWDTENPNLPKQVRERGFLEGFRAQQFTTSDRVSGGEKVPVYSSVYSQLQPYVSSNDVIGQVCRAACQILTVGFVALCVGQCSEAVAPTPKRGRA